MIIYRMETEYGGGVYNCEEWERIEDTSSVFSASTHILEHTCELILPHHPAPFDDKLFSYNFSNRDDDIPLSNLHFGFLSVEQFERWVIYKEMATILDEFNVKVLTFEVEESNVVVGDTQVGFIKEKAVLMKKENVLDFWLTNLEGQEG